MSLITTLIPLLSESTCKLVIELNGQGDGQVKAIVSPLIGEIAEDASDEHRKLKAALAMPLRCIGTPLAIEKELADHVRNYVFKRNQWEASLQALDAITPKIENKEDPEAGNKQAQEAQTTPDFEEVEFDL